MTIRNMPTRKLEGLVRLQAGVKPLQKGQPDMNPDGVKDILPHLRRSYSLTPLNRGLHPRLWSYQPFGLIWWNDCG